MPDLRPTHARTAGHGFDAHDAGEAVGRHGSSDHGGDDGHADHGHADEELGPVNVGAWAAGGLGILLGLVVVACLALASMTSTG